MKFDTLQIAHTKKTVPTVIPINVTRTSTRIPAAGEIAQQANALYESIK